MPKACHHETEPHVDYRPAAGLDHPRCRSLDGKELVANVGGLAFVPKLGRDIAPVVSVIAGRVVDQDHGRAKLERKGGKGIAQRVDVTQIAMAKSVAAAQALGQSRASIGIQIDKSHLRTLRGKSLDDLFAYPRRATRHNDRAAV